MHVELDEEEIFYVLAGSGLSWQEGAVHEIGPGDCIVHRVAEETHTIHRWARRPRPARVRRANERNRDLSPARTGRAHGRDRRRLPGPHPWDREAAAGDLELPEPTPRPPTIMNVETLEPDYAGDAGRWVLRRGRRAPFAPG